MYISEELHEILYQVGLWWLVTILAFIAAAFVVTKVIKWLSKNSRRIKFEIAMAVNAIELKIARRRCKAAMKVFDKPLSDAYKTIGRTKK